MRAADEPIGVFMYESGEDYLESILVLEKQNGIVRAIDVARKQHVSKPSVSRAMSILKETGYITISEDQHIALTEKGYQKASDVYLRHTLLTAFLQRITGVSRDQAEANACRVEHVIDADIVFGIQKWMEKNPE